VVVVLPGAAALQQLVALVAAVLDLTQQRGQTEQ
jgi:hypothetical protein